MLIRKTENNSVRLAGVIEVGPTLTYDVESVAQCTFTIMVTGQAIPIVVSNQHALWLVSTVSAGALVQIDGRLQDGGQGLVVQAVQVSMN